ncbi:MAG: acetolactate synthase small subunit [Clostridiales bacterium]|jgi:acetolactate synthase-1/3 small subunit|nr:acetolactate synthase small subunit [Clostridiales bacterium]
MKSILSVLVENRAGILARTAGLFARRGFNIESLAVGETSDPTVSRMTIVVDGDAGVIGQVEKQLNKQIDVIKVRSLDGGETIRRELALIKVAVGAQNRGQITDITAIMKANIVDLSPTTATVEIADTPERVRQLLGLLEPYGIVEMARTGMVALQSGNNGIGE